VSGDRGVTLVEILVVVVVIALVAGIAVVHLGSAPDAMRTEALARRVTSDLRLVRDTARDLGERRSIHLDADGGGYAVHGPDGLLPHPVSGMPFAIALEGLLPGGRFRFDPGAVPGDSLGFGPDGLPEGGYTLTVRGASAAWRIDVARDTGRITLTGLDGGG